MHNLIFCFICILFSIVAWTQYWQLNNMYEEEDWLFHLQWRFTLFRSSDEQYLLQRNLQMWHRLRRFCWSDSMHTASGKQLCN